MTQQNKMPYLYILMRSDMSSLNPGKAMAQACHAANMFMFKMTELKNSRHTSKSKKFPVRLHKQVEAYDAWVKSVPDQHYGTTIVLDGIDEERIRGACELADMDRIVNGIVVDPTYPLLDGAIVHHLKVMTCAYVFGYKDDVSHVLETFKLHK